MQAAQHTHRDAYARLLVEVPARIGAAAAEARYHQKNYYAKTYKAIFRLLQQCPPSPCFAAPLCDVAKKIADDYVSQTVPVCLPVGPL
jgi:hypothetical protein